MKKVVYILSLWSLILSAPFFDWATTLAGAAEKIQYGGTISLVSMIDPMSWDIVDWNWKHASDTSFYMEHLMMGNLQKGPR